MWATEVCPAPDPRRAAAEAMIARAQRGDEAALRDLYAEHAPSILRFLTDLIGDRAGASDATQETFVRAFRRLDTLRPGAGFAPWLFGIARHVAMEQRRARRRRERVLVHEREEPEDRADTGGSPEATLLGREAAAVLSRALETLSEERRAMLILRLDHGLSYEEIATTMECSVAKAKVEVHRARQSLREALSAYGANVP